MSAPPRAEPDPPRPPSTWARVSQHWKLATALLVLLIVLPLYPFVGGALATRALSARAAKMGLDVEVARARAGLTGVSFERLLARPARGAEADTGVRVAVDKLAAPFSAAWGSGVVQIEGATVQAPSLRALRQLQRSGRGAARASDGGKDSSKRYPILALTRGRVAIGSGEAAGFKAENLSGRVVPGDRLRLSLANVAGNAAILLGTGGAGAFGAKAVHLEVALAGLRPAGVPSVTVEDGYVQALPTLGLTGITGGLVPKKAQPRELAIDFHGSYGGSRERLWNAVGGFRIEDDWQDSEGNLTLRAERFTLDKIKDVLPPTVSHPENTSVAGALTVTLHEGVVGVSGALALTNLGVFHKALASAPVEGLSASVDLQGSYDGRTRVLNVERLEGRLKDLTAIVAARLELQEGTYTFEDGRTWPWLPKIQMTLDVPKLPCQKVLSSFPAALIPRLQGFNLKGTFETHLETNIDYANLEALSLDGKVGIDGCKVAAAPVDVVDLTDADMPITHVVEVPPPWDDKGTEPQELVFVVGPDSADFVPLAEVSPHLVNAFLTTEDSGFFKHRGFATREFKTALKRNLERGRFRQGASSITMQMVKNLLLSHEKTLSRKLQELFLVWYLEQVLSKERILELYLNAIEFGPRIYGVGPAARHYFGKAASDLTPAEAAFFSSILPSPKRRYVSYCHGALSSSADKHIKRILTRMRERERLTDEELAQALQAPLTFDTTERGANERQCLDWIARITAVPKAEPETVEDTE